MSIDGRPIGENTMSPWASFDHHVAIARTNQNAAGEKEIAGTAS